MIPSDNYLINLVQQTGDSQAMSELLARHSGIYHQILDQQLPDTYPEKQELKLDKDYQIYDCVLRFDPARKMKFPTWVGQNIKWKTLNIYNRTPKPEDRPDFYSLEDSADNSYEVDFSAIDGTVMEHFRAFAEEYPDLRARFIFKARYDCDKQKHWKQISQELGIGIATCANIHKKFVRDAQKFLIKNLS